MSATDDRLDILIGRLLDGEISPAERRILDRELEHNAQARELLEQMRVLHDCGREIVESRVRQGGAAPEEIFERAWRQSRGSVPRRILRIGGWSRLAVGVAAGFLLGMAVHFVLVKNDRSLIDDTNSPPIARDASADRAVPDESWRKLQPRTFDPVTREVEWYGFTDQAGNQWLIEGYREGMARPASYHGGL
jgi:anti-sigma factor RsiW